MKNVFTFIRIWLLCASTLAATLTAFAQQQTALSIAPSSGKYTYLYRISNERTTGFYKHQDELIPIQVTDLPTDSFPSDSFYQRELSPGNYVYVRAIANELQYTIQLVYDFEVTLVDDPRALSVSVLNKNGSVIGNAEVNLSKIKLSFDSIHHCYSKEKCNKQGLLKVEVNGQLALFNISRQANNHWFLRPLKRIYYWLPFDNIYYGIKYDGDPFKYFGKSSYSTAYDGYVVINQPKYRIGDTVKIKAFLLGKNNRPVKHSLLLTIGETYGKEILRTVVEPQTKGDFIYNFVIADSVEIDRTYHIAFTSTNKKKDAPETQFRIEDYQLDETYYKVNFIKHDFINTEPVSFEIESHDANGLPLPDSRVQVLLLPRTFQSTYLPLQYVNDTLWKFEGMLDADGSTSFSIPDSVLPRAKMNLVAQFFFANSNNEIRDTSINCSIDKPEKIIDLRTDGDLVKADLILDGSSVHSVSSLTIRGKNGILLQKEIDLPFAEKINTLASEYVVTYDRKSTTLDLSDEEDEIEATAFRSEDSVYMTLKNPRKWSVAYSIFDGSVKIESGSSETDITWKRKDNSKRSWHFLIVYLWAGESKRKLVNAILYDKMLNVQIDQPPDVFPGEESDVKISVTDYEGKPVSKVNVTASSVNSQFESFDVPALPSFSKVNGRVHYYNNFDLTLVNREFKDHMSAEWINRFRLDTSLYYQFLYPKEKITILYDSLNLSNAQFSVYACTYGISFSVEMIYANDRLVFFSGTEDSRPYSIVIPPGKYKLKIRSGSDEYITDSILFKKGFKTEIVINSSRVVTGPEVSWRDAGLKFSQQDINALQHSLLFFDAVEWNEGQIYIRSNGNVSRITKRSYTHHFYSAGPFNAGDPVEIRLPEAFSRTFTFTEGMNCTIDSPLITCVSQTEFPYTTKTDIYHYYQPHLFGELALTDSDIVNHRNSQFKTKPFARSLSSSNQPGNGAISFMNETDSTFFALILERSADSIQRWVLDATRKIYYDLLPGRYTARLYTNSGYFIEVDSLVVKSSQTRWQVIPDGVFYKADTSGAEWGNIFLPEIFHNYSRVYRFGNCDLQGKVFDEKTNEGVPFAAVVLMQAGQQVATAVSDENGNYQIDHIAAGSYTVTVHYLGYEPTLIPQVRLQSNFISFCNISLTSSISTLNEIVVTAQSHIEADQTSVAARYSPISYGNEVSYMALTAGVYQKDDFDPSSIQGTRDESNQYFVDGIKMRGIIADKLTSVELSEAQNAIREKFFDYAYWQPNLFTNDSGMVSFRVKFPDNITKWNSYALAMNNKKMAGSAYTYSRSWKKLSASLELPRFLVEGDESEAIGKVNNYTGKDFIIKTDFELNGRKILSRDTLLENFYFDRIPLSAASEDSIECTYTVHAEKYYDGEHKTIPVIPRGIERSVGNFYVLNGDTSIEFTAGSSGAPVYVSLHANLLEVFKDDLSFLRQYPYLCNEQLASKLIGVTLERQSEQLQLSHLSAYSSRIEKTLLKNQLDDGSWGWWSDSRSNIWMTCYVLHALHMSNSLKSTYDSPEIYRGVRYLRESLPFLNSIDLLDALQVMRELKESLDYDSYLKKINVDSVDEYSLMKYLFLRKETGEEIDLKILLEKKRETLFGSIYWGTENLSWYDNSIQLTALAYKIFRSDSQYRDLLPAIRSYFLEEKNSALHWKSTKETAQILEAILPDLFRENQAELNLVSVKVNGTRVSLSGNSYVNRTFLSDKIIVGKSGSSPVYLSCYQNFFDRDPIVIDKNFSVNTSFVSNGKTTDTLIAGKYATLHVQLKVKNKCDYVMITVPIPAGCSYGDNYGNRLAVESHCEFMKDKTVIFCETLAPGEYEFTINLEARFKGAYTMNPVQVQLMYFPIFDANNIIKKTIIN